MTVIEYIRNYIEKNLTSQIEKNKDAIIEYLKNNNKISIQTKDYELDDIIRVKNNSGFSDEEPLITVDENGITVRGINSNLIKLVIENLPSDIEELDVPKEIFNQIKISYLKNTKKLTVQGNIPLSKEFIEKIRGLTSIREIITRINSNEVPKDDDTIFLGGLVGSRFIYKDLVITSPRYDSISSYNVECNSAYDRLDEILNNINSDNIGTVSIYKNGKADTFINKTIFIQSAGVKDKKIDYNISFKDFNSISEIEKALKSIENKGISISSVRICLVNKDYDDIEHIKVIQGKYPTRLEYDHNIVSLEDFKTMRATLDYYRDQILEANLSPLEKVLYAYDIIKSFEYEEAKNKSDSRSIHSIIRDGKIVCVGYAVFLEQLLKEVGIEATSISTMVPDNKGRLNGHKRNIIKIVDKKYNVNGSFAFDATWDSARNLSKVITTDGVEKIREAKKIDETDTVVKSYDNLSLYNCFMIPASRYQQVFAGEKMPNFEDEASANRNKENTIRDIGKSFDSVTGLDPTTFLELVATVRMKEGYSKEATLESIKGIVEIQEYLRKRNSQVEDVVIKK